MRAYQPSFRWILSTGVAVWGAVALLIGWAGTLPDGYLIHVRGITAAQPYPAGAIAIELSIVALSLSLIVWAAVASGWKRVGRMFLAFLVSAAIGNLAALGAMHSPDHYVYFGLSMLAISAVSLLALIMLLAIRLLGRKSATVRSTE